MVQIKIFIDEKYEVVTPLSYYEKDVLYVRASNTGVQGELSNHIIYFEDNTIKYTPEDRITRIATDQYSSWIDMELFDERGEVKYNAKVNACQITSFEKIVNVTGNDAFDDVIRLYFSNGTTIIADIPFDRATSAIVCNESSGGNSECCDQLAKEIDALREIDKKTQDQIEELQQCCEDVQEQLAKLQESFKEETDKTDKEISALNEEQAKSSKERFAASEEREQLDKQLKELIAQQQKLSQRVSDLEKSGAA